MKICDKDIESLIVQMLVFRYLEEAFSSTAYTVNVYVALGNQALRLARLNREDIVNGFGPRIQCSFRRLGRKVKNKKVVVNRKSPGNLGLQEDISAGPSRIRQVSPPKKKRHFQDVSAPDDQDVDETEDFTSQIRTVDAEESDADDDDWAYSLRPPQPAKRRRTSGEKAFGISARLNRGRMSDDEVISLSSD